MKKRILIVLSLICLIVIALIVTHDNSQKIITEQGDVFYVNVDTYLNKTSVKTEDGLTFRYSGYEDSGSFLCIWDNDNIRAYLLGNKILYRCGEEQFQLIGNIEDLEQNKNIEPAVKSVLFKNQFVLDTYLDHFLTSYPDEFEPIINDFLHENYSELSEYGFDNKVTSNSYELQSFTETINRHLDQRKE